MRGTGYKNAVAENMLALSGERDMGRMRAKFKMCWRCQKDKSPYGGHIKTFTGGPMKFICKDCLDAKEQK